MTDAHLLPFLKPAEGESLPAFLRRAVENHDWPAEERERDLTIMQAMFELLRDPQEEVRLAAHVVRALSFAVDPSMALRHLDRYLRARGDNAASELLSLRDNSEHLHFLASLFSFSDYLSEVVIRSPEFLASVFRSSGLNKEKKLERYRTQLAERMEGVQDFEERRRVVTRYKKRELLRIGIRDLREMADTISLCRELSNLAQAITEAAYRECYARAIERHGRPQYENGHEGTPGFCIYAMGKFGAGELNFSSDVDLIYVYDEEGETTGVPGGQDGAYTRKVSNHEFFGRLGRELAQYLSGHSEEGFLYRVDLRLRPEGGQGPVARSRSAYVAYLAGHAGLWEKIAYLKARFIVGDDHLAALFDPILQQFVFTNNDENELLPEIARLKRRIDHDALNEESRELDIKRGVGGIREIEFIVAALQLVHGEKIPALRIRPTIEAMELLVGEDLMERETATTLKQAYFLFRRIEHTLQMMHESQTHRMPSETRERAALALRCGFLNSQEFEELLDQLRDFVRMKFEEAFHEQGQAGKLELNDYLFMEAEPPAAALEELERAGLPDQEGFRLLQKLATGTQEYSPSAKAQLQFQRLLPTLLEELRTVAIPLQAIRQFDLLLRAARGFTWVYDLCLSNPLIARLFLRTLGFGSLLGRQLVAHPEWLDELFNNDGLKEERTERALAETDLSFPSLSPEAALRQLRNFKQLEGFMISTQEVLAIAPSASAAARVTRLAEGVLQGITAIATRAVLEKSDMKELPVRWAVIGLGGIGDNQVHIGGDLDVAFVVEHDGQLGEMTALRWVDKICQRIISEMCAISPEGQLWKVDARLRPDGKNGPLAATRERFLNYYRSEAGIWEWQVLTKARVVAGDLEFGRAVLADIHAAFCEIGPIPNLKEEIRTMRGRIEENVRLPRNAVMDIKRGPGGVVDAEFLVQYFQLRNCEEAAALFPLKTEEALLEFGRRGDIAESDAKFIVHHLGILRLVQRFHRLLWETTNDFLPADRERMDALRRGLAEQLLGDIDEVDGLQENTVRMRKVFEKYLGD